MKFFLTALFVFLAGLFSAEASFISYDHEGRRVWKQTEYLSADGSTVERTVTTKFVYDDWLLLAEIVDDSETGQSARYYTWANDVSGTVRGAGGVGGLIAIRESTGAIYHPAYDAAGNVIALLNGSGSEVAHWRRGPFGEVFESSGETGKCPMGFATHYTDSETGLVYFGYRYYSPATGRWLSREPLGEFESFNLYAYCGNDPVGKVDYLRLEELSQDSPTVESLLLEAHFIDQILSYNRANKDRAITHYFDAEGKLRHLSPNLVNRDRLDSLDTLLEIHDEIGEGGYGTWNAIVALRKHFGYLYDPAIAEKYFKPKSGFAAPLEKRQATNTLAKGGGSIIESSLSLWGPMGFSSAGGLRPLSAARLGVQTTGSGLRNPASFANSGTNVVTRSGTPTMSLYDNSLPQLKEQLRLYPSEISEGTIIRELRRSGKPEALATSKLMKRGRVTLNLVSTDPYKLGAAGRGSWAPSTDIYVALDRVGNIRNAAGITTHETKHVLQRLTPSSYRRIHELEAYQWQRAAGYLNMSDEQIISLIKINPLYKNVPGVLP